MQDLLPNIKIEMPEGIFLKDPETSTLGKKIIEHSIILIENIGFEDFNFKKLGALIGSNESSIYRYFDNKHKLLIYLTSWYWSWIEYQLLIETYSVENNTDKLKKAIKVVTRTTKQDSNYSHINEVLLNKIIVSENSKSYLTKEVDLENESGFFKPYKRVVYRLAEIIKANNNSYNDDLSLASTILEGSLHQHYLKSHFKTLTNCNSKNTPTDFFTNLVLNTILIHGE
jgi:AcrR family transcriptional regulator